MTKLRTGSLALAGATRPSPLRVTSPRRSSCISRTRASMVSGSTSVLRRRSAMTRRPTTASSQRGSGWEGRVVGVVPQPAARPRRGAAGSSTKAKSSSSRTRSENSTRRSSGDLPAAGRACSSRKRGPLTVPSGQLRRVPPVGDERQHRVEPAGRRRPRRRARSTLSTRRRRISGYRRQPGHGSASAQADDEGLAADGVLELRDGHGQHLTPRIIAHLGNLSGSAPAARCARRCRAATAASSRSAGPRSARSAPRRSVLRIAASSRTSCRLP